MTIKSKEIEELSFRSEHCEETEQKLIEILNNSSLNMKELLWVLAHVMIDLGTSIEGITGPVNYKDLYRDYYANPSLGRALAAQGVHLISVFIGDEKEESESTDD